MEEKLHRRWVKIGGKKGSIFDGNFHTEIIEGISKLNIDDLNNRILESEVLIWQ